METQISSIDELFRDCLAVRVRMIGRAITATYDHAVQEHGVSIAQVNLMAAVGKMGTCTPTRLGHVMQMDRSTVSRNLDLLLASGWIKAASSNAKGIKEVALTPAGRKKIDSVMVDWRDAQRQAVRLLGEDGERAVRAVASRLMTEAIG